MEPKRSFACPCCMWPFGFHDRQVHDNFMINPIHFKEKDWQKNGQGAHSSASTISHAISTE